MRENAYDRGRRYLGEGRLIVHHADEHHLEALVRGTGEVWVVTYERGVRNCDV